MKLRQKLVLFITPMILLLLIVTFVSLDRILLTRFALLDEGTIRASMADILYSFEDEMQLIETNMLNYSARNETYAFVQQRPDQVNSSDPYLRSKYVPETFIANRIHLIALFDGKRRLLYGLLFDSVSRTLTPLTERDVAALRPEQDRLFTFWSTRDSHSGLLSFRGDPMLVTSLPVLKDDRSGPIQGTLIAGRLLDAKEMDRINTRSRALVRTMRYDPALLPAQTAADNERIWLTRHADNNATIHAVMNDVFGQPFLIVSTDKTSAVYQSGKRDVHNFAVIMILVLVGFAAWGYAVVDRSVLRRIRMLVAGIHNISRKKDFTLRIKPTGRDEFSELELEFNGMMQSLEQAQNDLRHQMHIDPLTRLANRTLFYDLLEAAIGDAERSGRQLAVVFIDLDHFKSINDSWGHDHGDQFLRDIATRIRSAVRSGDLVSRLGGDEFTVLLTDVSSQEHALRQAELILGAIGRPMYMKGHRIDATASMGVSTYPQDGTTAELLVKHADLAMFHVKQSTRNSVYPYSEELEESTRRKMLLEQHLQTAVANGELSVHYQPIVTSSNSEPVKAEALLRWHHPELGFVSPGEFIPLAEATGMIIDIGAWVIQQACRDMMELRRRGLALRASVNISVMQLEQPSFISDLFGALSDNGLDPAHLELEITESILLSSDMAAVKLQKLRRQGVSISLDDFGTGYSSLSYLRRFPVDTIKLDQSFISNIVPNPLDKTIVQAIIDLGHNLNLNVVAEGVEQAEQLALLQQLGCDEIQGYFVSRPLRFADLIDFLHQAQPQTGA